MHPLLECLDSGCIGNESLLIGICMFHSWLFLLREDSQVAVAVPEQRWIS